MIEQWPLSSISCSVLGKEDYAAAVELLTDAFCRNDPVESALKITPDEFRLMVELDLASVWRAGLSFVAQRPNSRELVGVIVAMDALSESDSSGRISDKFAPISEVARDFHHLYLTTRHVRPGSSLYIFMLGVTPHATGQGIGKLLIGEALRNARSRGYESAFTIATNLASMQALKRQGFESLSMICYQSYRYLGRPVFESITQHPGIVLMERCRLDSLPS